VSSFGVILDACVLYPMYLRDTLLRAAEAGLYRVQWSADILDEMSRNIVASGHATRERVDRLLAMMRGAFPEAEVTGHQLLIGSMLNDPKDRHVTAAAVACGAHVIVTVDLSPCLKAGDSWAEHSGPGMLARRQNAVTG
jgi:predicted nucleic acid-binding protein